MVDQIITVLAYALALPLIYVALFIADRLRPIDISMRRRLLLVVLSTVITTPIALVSIYLVPLVFLIDVVLIRWVYVDSWGGAAIRVFIWRLFCVLLAVVFGIVLVVSLQPTFYVQPFTSESSCAQAGERSANPSLGPNDSPTPCCEGLVRISAANERRYIEDAEGEFFPPTGSALICSACGNGICEAWEHRHNCPGDCT